MKLARARSGIVAAIAIIALVATVMGRVLSESRHELALADEHRQRDRVELAIEHYRRAIRWSFPSSSITTEAVSALESIAEQLEAEGDVDRALYAWRSLSGGLAAIRFLYSHPDPARDNANEQIARLVAKERTAAIDASLSDDQLTADHGRLLSEAVSPDPWWGTLLLLGMVIWVGALVITAGRGFDSSGRLRWTSARWPLLGAMIGFASFVLGLVFA